jgi:hypothetical protein
MPHRWRVPLIGVAMGESKENIDSSAVRPI